MLMSTVDELSSPYLKRMCNCESNCANRYAASLDSDYNSVVPVSGWIYPRSVKHYQYFPCCWQMTASNVEHRFQCGFSTCDSLNGNTLTRAHLELSNFRCTHTGLDGHCKSGEADIDIIVNLSAKASYFSYRNFGFNDMTGELTINSDYERGYLKGNNVGTYYSGINDLSTSYFEYSDFNAYKASNISLDYVPAIVGTNNYPSLCSFESLHPTLNPINEPDQCQLIDIGNFIDEKPTHNTFESVPYTWQSGIALCINGSGLSESYGYYNKAVSRTLTIANSGYIDCQGNYSTSPIPFSYLGGLFYRGFIYDVMFDSKAINIKYFRPSNIKTETALTNLNYPSGNADLLNKTWYTDRINNKDLIIATPSLTGCSICNDYNHIPDGSVNEDSTYYNSDTHTKVVSGVLVNGIGISTEFYNYSRCNNYWDIQLGIPTSSISLRYDIQDDRWGDVRNSGVAIWEANTPTCNSFNDDILTFSFKNQTPLVYTPYISRLFNFSDSSIEMHVKIETNNQDYNGTEVQYPAPCCVPLCPPSSVPDIIVNLTSSCLGLSTGMYSIDFKGNYNANVSYRNSSGSWFTVYAYCYWSYTSGGLGGIMAYLYLDGSDYKVIFVCNATSVMLGIVTLGQPTITWSPTTCPYRDSTYNCLDMSPIQTTIVL